MAMDDSGKARCYGCGNSFAPRLDKEGRDVLCEECWTRPGKPLTAVESRTELVREHRPGDRT